MRTMAMGVVALASLLGAAAGTPTAAQDDLDPTVCLYRDRVKGDCYVERVVVSGTDPDVATRNAMGVVETAFRNEQLAPTEDGNRVRAPAPVGDPSTSIMTYVYRAKVFGNSGEAYVHLTVGLVFENAEIAAPCGSTRAGSGARVACTRLKRIALALRTRRQG